MKQIVSVATRKSAVLEVILTDLATLYHPPTSRPPLEVDKVSRCPALLPPYHHHAPTITAASPGADRHTAQSPHPGQYTPTAGGNFAGWDNWSAKLVTVASWCHYGQLVLLWPADGSGWPAQAGCALYRCAGSGCPSSAALEFCCRSCQATSWPAFLDQLALQLLPHGSK